MTPSDFQKHVLRLAKVYGDRAYPQERVQLIWRKIGHRSERVLSSAIDMLIADSAQPPLLTKILEAVSAAAKTLGDSDDPHADLRLQIAEGQRRTNACRKCHNIGTIRAYRKDKPGQPEEYLICDCRYGELAKQLPENRRMPSWLYYYDFYYVLDSESASRETLAKFSHVCDMPPEQRAQEMLKVMSQLRGA